MLRIEVSTIVSVILLLFNKKLIEELEWLKSVRCLLLKEVAHKKGQVSGYKLKSLTEKYLNEAIEKLEKTNSKVDINSVNR